MAEGKAAWVLELPLPSRGTSIYELRSPARSKGEWPAKSDCSKCLDHGHPYPYPW